MVLPSTYHHASKDQSVNQSIRNLFIMWIENCQVVSSV